MQHKTFYSLQCVTNANISVHALYRRSIVIMSLDIQTNTDREACVYVEMLMYVFVLLSCSNYYTD